MGMDQSNQVRWIDFPSSANSAGRLRFVMLLHTKEDVSTFTASMYFLLRRSDFFGRGKLQPLEKVCLVI